MTGMTLIVKQVTKLVTGFIFLYSAYLILFGHLSPGGGFVGGVTLACGVILVVLAFGKPFGNNLLTDRAAAVWDCVGALGFLVIALAGYLVGHFFVNILAAPGDFRLFSGGTIPLANIAIGIKVGACLAGVFLALAAFRVGDQSSPDKLTEDQQGR